MFNKILNKSSILIICFVFISITSCIKGKIHKCDELASHQNDSLSPCKGVEFNNIDIERAEKACKEAVSLYPENMRYNYQYGRVLLKKKDCEKSSDYMNMAIRGKYPEALNTLGRKYECGGECISQQSNHFALEWYHRAAYLGSSSAMYNIGNMYYKGKGVKQDCKTALEWYHKAAKKDNTLAMNEIGNMYNNGRCVVQDYEIALKWYNKAARNGNDKAMNNIGFMYYKGRGVKQEYKMAIEWYHKAAKQGNVRAMYNISNMYEDGAGVQKDDIASKKWYKRAKQSDYSSLFSD